MEARLTLEWAKGYSLLDIAINIFDYSQNREVTTPTALKSKAHKALDQNHPNVSNCLRGPMDKAPAS